MCFEVKCDTCGKRTWGGCGKHKESVLSKIPKEEQCTCNKEKPPNNNDNNNNNELPANKPNSPTNQSEEQFVTNLANEITKENELKQESSNNQSDTKTESKTDDKQDKKDKDEFPVNVYVRIRPLVGTEINEKHKSIEYNIKKNKKNGLQSLTIISNEIERPRIGIKKPNNKNNNNNDKKNGKNYKGLKKIIDINDDNIKTYQLTIKPVIEFFMQGKAVCAFAYGHTGSGKTHTIFGYGDKHPGLFSQFGNELVSIVSKLNNDTQIEIRFLELYQNKIRDLLTKDKQECFLREDDRGNVNVRAPTVTYKNGRVVTPPLSGIQVTKIDELSKAVENGIKSRNVGNSTLHDKSSRSHAFLEFELVTPQLVKIRNELPNEEANCDYLKREYDLVAKKVKAGNKENAKKKLDKSKTKIKEYKKELKKILNNKDRPYVGGTFIFVDLAGNEFGSDEKKKRIKDFDDIKNNELTNEQKKEIKNKLAQETSERNEINTSLLALKEVIRALNNKRKHIPYRNHKLTMYLRKYFIGNGSKGIMISNIGPSDVHVKKTLNTMRYTESIANTSK